MRRFSVAVPMVVVLLCGVGVAALKNASEAWVGVLLAITLLLLGISLVGILQRRAGERAFWQGFAIFGWGYAILTMGPWFAEEVGARLPTAALLSYVHAKVHPEALQAGMFEVMSRGVLATGGVATGDVVYAQAPAGRITLTLARNGEATLDRFLRVGHCLFAMLAALGGGLIARAFHRTNQTEAA